MKFIVAVTFVIASATALPQSESIQIDFRDERSVSSNIIKGIEDASQTIKDAGFDPMYIKKYSNRYELPVPVIFNSAVLIEELLSNGMSNIVVNSVSYNFFTSRVKFDIELPLIDFSVGAAKAEATLFGNTSKIETSGKVEIQRIHIIGQIRVSASLISGITIHSMKINFTLGGINPDVKFIIQDVDYSEKVNEFLATTIPDTFKAYSSEINELLEIVSMDFIKEYMKVVKT